MRDSVPSTRYSSVCNVLRQWNIPLIPTYRVYRLYDIYILWYVYMHVIIMNITLMSLARNFTPHEYYTKAAEAVSSSGGRPEFF